MENVVEVEAGNVETEVNETAENNVGVENVEETPIPEPKPVPEILVYRRQDKTKIGLSVITIHKKGSLYKAKVEIGTFFVFEIFDSPKTAFLWAYGVKQKVNDRNSGIKAAGISEAKKLALQAEASVWYKGFVPSLADSTDKEPKVSKTQMESGLKAQGLPQVQVDAILASLFN